ncbi:hypothetical protein CYY_005125 [Polysphondylium violaceum]|uniref:cystathionine gamma-lyase n=1 Tax=Polysphondylium violaceum TaxID=133409 RepID=A0A8J4USF8_9MYCE|nr:hypothetical protein CYY_005125 [Polysphondylium violaceum]
MQTDTEKATTTTPNKLGFDTLVTKKVEVRGPVSPLCTPIYQTSTFVLKDTRHGASLCSHQELKQDESPYLYSRWSNPTNDVLERLITTLEGGYSTYVTSSGMAAISTVLLSFLKAGDHVIITNNVYGGTHEFATDILSRYGVEVSWVDQNDVANYRNAIKPNTKLMYGETPANPTMVLLDLQAFGALGKERGILTVVDSTFASPYNQRPIEFGVDVVVHSATKYYGGHSDLIAGAIIVANETLDKSLAHQFRLFGGALAPNIAFLLHRGIKTLALRMERHNNNALQLARYLESHPKIKKVHYPGLESHPQHELAKKQMRGFGGMIGMEIHGGLEAGRYLVENLKVFTLAVSLGGVESLIEQASTMTHGMLTAKDREKAGIPDGFLRLSVGCEDVNDLIQDLETTLSEINI